MLPDRKSYFTLSALNLSTPSRQIWWGQNYLDSETSLHFTSHLTYIYDHPFTPPPTSSITLSLLLYSLVATCRCRARVIVVFIPRILLSTKETLANIGKEEAAAASSSVHRRSVGFLLASSFISMCLLEKAVSHSLLNTPLPMAADTSLLTARMTFWQAFTYEAHTS